MKHNFFNQFKNLGLDSSSVRKCSMALASGLLLSNLAPTQSALANQPDSLYIYSYATTVSRGQNGLHMAWSSDGENWQKVADNFAFVKSDFGQWGSQKRMLRPFVLQDKSGTWHALWSVNEQDGCFAHASSKDFRIWKPQDYPTVMPQGANCMDVEARYDANNDSYIITFLSQHGNEEPQTYACVTRDFINFSSARAVPGKMRLNNRKEIGQLGKDASGTITKVPSSFVHDLNTYCEGIKARNARFNETNAYSDAQKFKGMKPVSASLTVSRANSSKTISPNLMGIFFEDISHAADGGLYAELIENRDFEYTEQDNKGKGGVKWNALTAWSLKGDDKALKNASLLCDTVQPIHAHNPHYAVLSTTESDGQVALCNTGFDGININAGATYDLNLKARLAQGKGGKLAIKLVTNDGQVVAEKTITANSANWKDIKTSLKANQDATNAHLEIVPQCAGTWHLDMVSLFPRDTFKGRKNGLRKDLAQVIADLQPRFVRFPGGCVTHGDGLDNIYRWKRSIGPLEERQALPNIWHYHQSLGLGFFEYFQFCEDINAEPLPVLAAGVPCQNSGTGGPGQQGGIPMGAEMEAYTQDILDLIEYANGDAKKSVWGKKRAEAGHPKPFNLKYLGIGNEDLISEVFKERFEFIYNKVKEKYPEIVVIGTVGPFWEGSDYEEGWKFATEQQVPIVDEHYYENPGWFIQNQNFYDSYDRNKSHVYLGEYASRGNTLYNALAEATYLCGVERNGDVVEMTSYAPLLAKDKQTNWNPDLIYFDNSKVRPTVNYYVQKLFSTNTGTTYYNSVLTDIHGTIEKESDPVERIKEDVSKRLASSIVYDDKTGEVIVKLVNVLPTSTRVDITCPEITSPREASITTLSGQAEDRNYKNNVNMVPQTQTRTLSEPVFNVELPAYSLTVIRYKW